MSLKDEVKECAEMWHDVLKKYDADRNLMPMEDAQIARAIQLHGAEFVKLAFLGAKYEPSSADYKPSRYMTLMRVLDSRKIQFFVNLGAQAQNKLKALAEEQKRREAYE